MDAGGPRSLMDRGYLAGLVGVLSLEAVGVAYQIATGVAVPAASVIAAAFVVACMLRIHGLWGTMAFAVLVFAIPYGSEFLGVLTGVPYGTYAYADLIGPRLFGLVPIFIFIAWIHIGYLSIATTTLAYGRSSLWLAPLDGVLAVSWDVMVDPLAVRAGFWSWEGSGAFYGIPLTNFLGWFLVVTILSLLARTVWSRDERAPARTPRSVARILPALLLATTLSFGVLAAWNGLLVAAFVGNAVLVPAVAIAWIRMARTPQARTTPNPWAAGRRVPAPGPSADRT